LVQVRRILLALIFCAIFVLPVNTLSLDETLTSIKHVIIIMQENHSFDNYFGTYPTANGTLVNSVTSQLETVNGMPNGVCQSSNSGCLSPHLVNGGNTTSPVEGQLIYESDYSNSTTGGFPRNSGPQSMGYFDYHQIPAYWDYAEEYGLGENYFATILSTTTPNRLVLFAGDTPVSGNYGPPPYVPYNDTILSQLTAYGISWGYFDQLWPFGQTIDVYPFNYLSGITPDALTRIQDDQSFLQYLSSGQGLPSVSFVMELGVPSLDEHPPGNVTTGELWTVSLVNALMKSSYWDSSAVFITWDEGGGYYDHVTPPKVLTIDHGFTHELHAYGQRVPLIVISPYSKENYVSRTLLNHMSLLKFVEYNWNLQSLNENVANSNNLLDFFDFNQTPRTPLILENGGPFSPEIYPIPLQTLVNQLPPSSGTVNETETQTSSGTPTYTFDLVAVIVAVSIVMAFAAWKRQRRRASKDLTISKSVTSTD
jgi:phospholipase C